MNKPEQPSPAADPVREFVIVGHGNLPKVQAMLAADPSLLNMAYEWKESDRETAMQGAAHVGSAAIAEYLLAQGAPLEICTAAMLGRRDAIERMLAADPAASQTAGAHGIPLLTHAAFSGDAELVRMLAERGAAAGVSPALYNAASRGHVDIVRWLLENREPDLTWQSFQGKTALAAAVERNDEVIASLLRAHAGRAT